MKFRSNNLLITGGAGFIGSNFISFLIRKYPDLNIYNFDKLTYAANLDFIRKFNNHEKYNFIEGDICNFELLKNTFKQNKIDGVINFAAETHVDNSIKSPDVFINTNILGTFNLLKIANLFWMKSPFSVNKDYSHSRFHQISTDEVYGSIDSGSFSENSNYSPNSPYSASKASADMLVQSFNKTYGLNTTISISSNNFGMNQNSEKFIPTIINNLIEDKPVPIYGDGHNVRDWLCVNDHCKAIDLIFNNSKTSEKYNIASGIEIRNIDLVDIIHKQLNDLKKVNKKIKYINDRFGHDKRYSMSIKKIKKDLDWTPSNNFEKKVKDYVNEYTRSKI